jgi:hypothetical protein
MSEIPMLARPKYIDPRGAERRIPNRPEEYHKPCADCNGWVSENNDHDRNCPRLVPYESSRRRRYVPLLVSCSCGATRVHEGYELRIGRRLHKTAHRCENILPAQPEREGE